MIEAKAVNFTQPSVIKVGISEMLKIIKFSEEKNTCNASHSIFWTWFFASFTLLLKLKWMFS